MQRRSRFEPVSRSNYPARRSPPPQRRSPLPFRRSPIPHHRSALPPRRSPPPRRSSPLPRRNSSPRREYSNRSYNRQISDDLTMPPRMEPRDREPEYYEAKAASTEYDRRRNEAEDDNLYFSDCVMYPPREGIDKPIVSRIAKPNGCKTIYIGGIPETLVRIPKRLEAIFTEVFTTNGGEIEMIRVSGRKFCHIRFKKEESVDKAMSLSGYWMEVKQGYEPAVRFRVIADFSESQVDQEEFESKKLIASRLNMEDTNIPKIPTFSSSAVEKLTADLKNQDQYGDAIVILRYWMSTNLDKQTSVRFFNLLQICYIQVKRLQSDKQQLGEEYDIIMERYNNNVVKLDKEFDRLMTLYQDAKRQKLWDHFSKAQRKSIDGWLESVRNSISTNEAGEQKSKTAREVAKNIVGGNATAARDVKMEVTNNNDKHSDVSSLQEAHDAMQKQVWDMVAKLHNKELELQAKQEQIDGLLASGGTPAVPAKRKRKEEGDTKTFDAQTVKIMCALTTFLHAYPKGATIENIEKYLVHECKLTVNRGNLESKLLEMGDVFSKQITVENNRTVSKWKYVFMDSH